MAKPLLRVRVVRWAFLLGLAAVVARAVQVQLVDGVRHRATARAQRTERVVLQASRGTIYDRSGVPLAMSREMYHVGIAPRELRDRARDTRTIAKALETSPGSVGRALTRSYAYFHGPYTAAQVAPLRAVPGVHLTHERQRFYPRPEFLRAVLGRPPADGRTASGMERVLDSLLTGTPGSAVVLRDGRGRRYESPARLGALPVAGHNVYLTIDAELQDIVETALADAIDAYAAAGGDVVVLDPRTGEVLAIASRRSDGSTPPNAFTSVFEPGSTAKLFAAASLLEAGLIGEQDSVFGERGTYPRPHRTPIRDEHPEGWMTLHRVIEASSNIGIVKFAARLTPAQQYQALRAFGLGTPTGIEYPAESRGSLPRPDEWSGLTSSSLAMGYEMAVTPLQLAQAYAAIANDGVMLRPSLLRRIEAPPPGGGVVYRHVPEPVRRVVRAEVAVQLRSMLRGVVYPEGTGSTAALTSYELAGKTGTARRAGQGGYVPGAYFATFASLFPADDPQLAMVVKLDDPRGAYARVTAAPVTRAVIEQVLAARTGALDPGALGVMQPLAAREPVVGGGSVPYVVSWPLVDSATETVGRRVPNPAGLTLRAAARLLHLSGFQVRIRGWGKVTRVTPAPGTVQRPGTVVTLFAEDGRP